MARRARLSSSRGRRCACASSPSRPSTCRTRCSCRSILVRSSKIKKEKIWSIGLVMIVWYGRSVGYLEQIFSHGEEVVGGEKNLSSVLKWINEDWCFIFRSKCLYFGCIKSKLLTKMIDSLIYIFKLKYSDNCLCAFVINVINLYVLLRKDLFHRCVIIIDEFINFYVKDYYSCETKIDNQNVWHFLVLQVHKFWTVKCNKIHRYFFKQFPLQCKMPFDR